MDEHKFQPITHSGSPISTILDSGEQAQHQKHHQGHIGSFFGAVAPGAIVGNQNATTYDETDDEDRNLWLFGPPLIPYPQLSNVKHRSQSESNSSSIFLVDPTLMSEITTAKPKPSQTVSPQTTSPETSTPPTFRAMNRPHHSKSESISSISNPASMPVVGNGLTIMDEADLQRAKNALRDNTKNEPSDFPNDAFSQRGLVKRIFNAMKNLEGIWDSPAVARKLNEIPDIAIEIVCWEVLLATRDAQENGHLLPSYEGSKMEEYNTFSERLDEVINACHYSKAFCRQLVFPPFVYRVADQPMKELARKKENKGGNERKKLIGKAGKEAIKRMEKGEEEDGEEKETQRPPKRRRTGSTRCQLLTTG